MPHDHGPHPGAHPIEDWFFFSLALIMAFAALGPLLYFLYPSRARFGKVISIGAQGWMRPVEFLLANGRRIKFYARPDLAHQLPANREIMLHVRWFVVQRAVYRDESYRAGAGTNWSMFGLLLLLSGCCFYFLTLSVDPPHMFPRNDVALVEASDHPAMYDGKPVTQRGFWFGEVRNGTGISSRDLQHLQDGSDLAKGQHRWFALQDATRNAEKQTILDLYVPSDIISQIPEPGKPATVTGYFRLGRRSHLLYIEVSQIESGW